MEASIHKMLGLPESSEYPNGVYSTSGTYGETLNVRTPVCDAVLYLALVLSFGEPLWAQPAQSTTQGLRTKIDDYMSRVSACGFSGTLLVGKDGDAILAKGHGKSGKAGALPHSLNVPKSLYQSPSGTSGSCAFHSASSNRSSSEIFGSFARSRR